MIIGLVGTATTIEPAAQALTRSGHGVVTYSRGVPATAAATGLRRVESCTALCESADVIASALDDDAALVEIVQRRDGLLRSLARGATHVTLGLHSPATIAQLAAAHAAAQQQFVAAPLLLQTSASPALTAVVSGSEAAMAPLAPLFAALGASVFPAGDRPEVAAMLALAHVALAGCAVQAMAEAFTLVRKYEVDPHVMYDVITDGLFGGSDVYKEYGAAMIDGTASGGHCTVLRALQVLDCVMAHADRARVPLPSVDACRDRLLGTLARGEGEQDWTVLYREQARASGLD